MAFKLRDILTFIQFLLEGADFENLLPVCCRSAQTTNLIRFNLASSRGNYAKSPIIASGHCETLSKILIWLSFNILSTIFNFQTRLTKNAKRSF